MPFCSSSESVIELQLQTPERSSTLSALCKTTRTTGRKTKEPSKVLVMANSSFLHRVYRPTNKQHMEGVLRTKRDRQVLLEFFILKRLVIQCSIPKCCSSKIGGE